MTEDKVPPAIDALLRERVEDYEQLEILRLLSSDVTAWWTSAELAARLNIGEEQIAAACRQLEKNRLSRSRRQEDLVSFAYAPATPELGLLVEQLFQLYQDHPIQIIKLMSANAIERVRTSALHTFADAFLLRRDKNNG